MTPQLRRISTIVVAAALATATMSCGNGGDQWSAAKLLDGDLGMVSCGGDVAMDAEGNALAIWCRHSEDYQGSVWVRRFAGARGWGAATRIDAMVGTGVSRPSVAVNEAGQAIAVWSNYDDDASRWRVWAATFDSSKGWAQPALIDGSAWNPSVALNNQGRATVVLTRYEYDTWETSIWASSYEPDTGWVSATRLDDEPSVPVDPDQFVEGVNYPRVSMNDGGDVVAVWIDGRTSSWGHLATSRYTPGTGWAPATFVDSPASQYIAPHLAMDDAGRAVAVSVGSRANSSDSTGGWSTVVHGDESTSFAPNVAMAKNGRAVVVWKQTLGDRKYLRASHFSPDEGWDAPQTVGESDDNTSSYYDWTGSDVTIRENGESLVVWHRERGQYSAELELPRFSVWANRFEPEAGWGTPTPLAAYEDADAYAPRLATDSQGRAIATWERSEIGSSSEIGFRRERSVWWSRFE